MLFNKKRRSLPRPAQSIAPTLEAAII